MICRHVSKKINGSTYCKLYKKIIDLRDCKCCSSYDYKTQNQKPIKKVSNKLIEKQKNRFSIIYHNLGICCVCHLKSGKYNNIELNEVYEGAKRQVSMNNGFVMPLCHQCHFKFHNDRNFALIYKKLFQQEYEKTHTRQDFINLIHKSYL